MKTALLNIRSSIGMMLIWWAIQIFPKPEQLLVCKALLGIKKEMQAVKYGNAAQKLNTGR